MRLAETPFGGTVRERGGPDERRQRALLDVRLLVAALIMWASVAATLAADVRVRACAAGALVLAATGVVLTRGSHGCRGRGTGHWGALVGLVLAVTGLGLTASAAHGAVREASTLDELARVRAVATLTGRVVADPVRVATSRPGAATVLVRVHVTGVVARGDRSAAVASVLVRGDERWASLRWHESVTFSGRLSPADPADPEIAAVRPMGPPTDRGPPGRVARAADAVRAGLARAADGLPADARGLLPGLVVGDTSRTPPGLTAAMRTTGMTHLSAVSGSNVAIVLVMVLWLCRGLGVPAAWRPVVGAGAVAGFVVLARPEPSVLRAAVMGCVGLIGVLTVRRAAGLPVLASAVVVLLVVDPWLARSYGFALSTLATLGLLLFVRSWGAAIDRHLPPRLGGLGQVLAIPAAAQLVCAPVVVLLQGSVSIVAVVANLLAAPFVAPATLGGVAAALAAVVSPAAASGLAWVGGVPTMAIARVARLCAEVPGGTAPWPDGALGAWLLAGLTLVVVLTGRWWAHLAVSHVPVALSLAVVVVAATVPTRALAWPPPSWVVVACDVGQGDALILRSGSRSAVLVDAGPDPQAVDRCLAGLGVVRLDAVLLTHFHADHVAGLPGALDGRPVGRILVSPVRDPAGQATEVDRWARQRGIPVEPVWAGDALAVGALRAQVWWPARRIDAGSVANNASVVLTVHDAGLSALLLGDVEREAAHQVLLALRRAAGDGVAGLPLTPPGGRIRFDVVKVAHHGSANIDPQLYAAVAAPVALVSVGEDNDYGHPAPSTSSALVRGGYAVWRTDLRGSVAVTGSGAGGRVGVSSTR